LKTIEIEGYLKWIGFQDNMACIKTQTYVAFYREGMPTVLIEVCAEPIDSEAIGCKECVEEGLNGYSTC
jgi:hypothetical protein